MQPAKDDVRPKAQSTTTTTTKSSTVGVKPKHRGVGCSSTSKSAGSGGGVSALMLREMEDLRNLAIGSPVPRPQTDDDMDMFAATFDDKSYPEIRIDRCVTTVDTSADDEPSRRPEDRTRNGRPRDDTAASKGGVSPLSSTSNHANSDQRCE